MPAHGPYAQYKTGLEAAQAARKSGISAIVVGGGIGGLVCATELVLNGHGPVTVYESVRKFARLGDTIGIMPNAGMIIGRWPGLYEQLDPTCGHSRGMRIHRYDGLPIVFQGPPPLPEDPTERAEAEAAEEAARRLAPMFDCHRGDLHRILLEYAQSVGVTVHQGVRVESYEESEDGASVSVDGKRQVADVVIAADGVKSAGRKAVLGYEDQPKSSGYAIFRAFFDGDLIRQNPVCAHLVADHVDQRNVWIGKDIHFISSGVRDTAEFSWVMTHMDSADVSEGWCEPGDIHEAIKVAAGFDPVVQAVIGCTPAGGLLDWKLVFRDPLPTWVSPLGKICLLGDAAHPHLPTSIQGASQAIEDGATLAQTLWLAGGTKEDVPLALRAYQEIRYDRTVRTQKLGVEVREAWHRPRDWDTIQDHPESVLMPHDGTIFDHDATAHAKKEFPAAVQRVLAKRKGDTVLVGAGADVPPMVEMPAAKVAVVA